MSSLPSKELLSKRPRYLASSLIMLEATGTAVACSAGAEPEEMQHSGGASPVESAISYGPFRAVLCRVKVLLLSPVPTWIQSAGRSFVHNEERWSDAVVPTRI